MVMMKLLSVSLALLSLSTPIQNSSPSPTRPALVFQVQTEKRTFKPGEAIWVSALLRNQSDTPWYVPHAMTPCSGLEAQVEFELSAVKGQLPLKGRAVALAAALVAAMTAARRLLSRSGFALSGSCCAPANSGARDLTAIWTLLTDRAFTRCMRVT